MNALSASEFAAGLAADLRSFAAICDEILALVSRENQVLANAGDYSSAEFHQRRKRLIPELESALTGLRKRRQLWCRTRQGSGHPDEIKSLFQRIQAVLMKILFLDRENQQALLRYGLVPANHLPPAATQQPHYVASLYRRYSSHPES